MKIAVPVRDEFVNEHFGQTDTYVVYSVSEENKILAEERVNAFDGCGCKSGIVEVLASKGVTIMLAGNMGAGAVNHLYAGGIDVIRGCAGKVGDVIQAYLSGKIVDNNQTCNQHQGCDDHHEHGHNHRHGLGHD